MGEAVVGPNQRGDSLAVRHISESGAKRDYTFAEIGDRASRLATVLRSLGVERGDRVAIYLPQSPEVPQVHLAAWKLGAISLPLTVLFGPDALRQRLGDGAPRVIACRAQDLEALEAICGAFPMPPKYVVVGGTGPLPDGAVALEDALLAASPIAERVATRATDPAFLSFTSGTTGSAKGALHCHRNLLGHIPGFHLSHNLFPQPGDLAWTPADWAWMGGFMDILFPSWYFGVPVLSFDGRFDPERAWRMCADEGVRNTFLPPTAVRLMRQAWTPEVGGGVAFRTIGSGGEALGADTLAWAQDALGLTINEFFGQTEVNLVLGNCNKLFDPVPGSMGRAYVGHNVAVLNQDLRPVPDGEEGEVAVSSDDPAAFLGYWNRPDATAEKVQDGWILTGDIARRDEGGYFWYESRKDDLISSSGYRIGPSEIEECLQSHSAVRLAAVIGSPDAVRGDIVKAFIELKPGHEPSQVLAREIQEHVRHRLAAYLYPREIEFIAAIPLTTTGKVKRGDLRAQDKQAKAAVPATTGGGN